LEHDSARYRSPAGRRLFGGAGLSFLRRRRFRLEGHPADLRRLRRAARARVASLICRKIVNPGARVLHFAPEVSLARQLVAVCGSGYEPVDINPPRYAKLAGVATVTRFDMCEDEPKGVYDLIIHNHVLEHVPCDYGAVLRRLHAAIRPGGGQLFSVPMAAPSYREDLDPSLSKEERTRRFGQYDHLRLFAVSDFAERLGVHVGLDAGYRLTDVLSPAELRRAAIPEPWGRALVDLRAQAARRRPTRGDALGHARRSPATGRTLRCRLERDPLEAGAMTDTTSIPAGSAQISGNVLFYSKPEPLSREMHSGLSFKQLQRPFAFAAATNIVPLAVTEFVPAALSYPIIFAGENKQPLAVMGVQQGENLFISSEGDAEPDAYLPA
jgi:hypothetical protein